MLWSKMIALQGEMYRGIARVEQRQGGVAVLCTLRPQPKAALTAYLITDRGIEPVALENGRGTLPDGTPAPAGMLVATSAPLTFLAQGAPRGTRLDFEPIKLRLRLEQMWSGKQAAAAAAEAEEYTNTGAPAIQIKETEETADAGGDQIKSFSSRTGTLLDILGPGEGAPDAFRQTPGPAVPVMAKPPPRAKDRPIAPHIKAPRAPEDGAGVRQEQEQADPFPGAFENAAWKRVDFVGTQKYYLQGQVRRNGRLFEVHALPGNYEAVPTMRRQGFTRFLRAADGTGYWLKFRRKE
ncbi:MAG: hypothetical protein GX637_04705 [Clostridiales bacterium]|nr:hypothetical protein [Clostridiales bacterium]